MTRVRRNKDLFESSLERLARILTDRFDIDVIFRGDDCMTDGRTIYLPQIPADAPDALLDAVEGYLDHEVAHLIFTDFYVNRAVQDPLTRLWLNVLEDARVEDRMQQLWRGCGHNFEKASKFSVELVRPLWDSLDDLNKLTKAACFYAKGEEDLIKGLPGGKEVLDDIEALKPALDKARAMPDTLHTLSLAAWLTRKMGHEPVIDEEDLPEPMAKVMKKIEEMMKSGASPEELSGGSGESLPAPGGTMPKESPKEASGGAEKEEGETGSGTTGASEPMPSKLKEAFDVDPTEIEELAAGVETGLAKSLSGAVGEYRHFRLKDASGYYLPYSNENDKIQVQKDGSRSNFKREQASVRSSTGVLVRKLQSSLIARARVVTQYGQTWGKLNIRAMPRLMATGNPRVFKRKSIGETLNVRMSVLLDQSGSMHGYKAREAKRMAIVFGDFCEKMKIPFEILGFTTVTMNGGSTRYQNAPAAERKKYSRWGDLLLYVYKAFPERWKKVNHRLMHFEGENHNVDGESVKIAAQRLLRASKQGERLILMVLSDGMPEEGVGEYQQNIQKHLKTVVQGVMARGVECIGIGVCTDSVKRYYPDWIVIDDPSSLAGKQLEKIKEVLHRGKKQARKRS